MSDGEDNNSSEEQWSFLEEFRFHSGNKDDVPLLRQFVEYVKTRTLPPEFANELDADGKSPYDLASLVGPISDDKTTALHCACANGCVANAKFLADELNAKVLCNANGNTPLHWAVQNGKTEIVQWLLSRYPDIDVLAKNNFGRSAMATAFEGCDEECVKALLNHDSALLLIPEEERGLEDMPLGELIEEE